MSGAVLDANDRQALADHLLRQLVGILTSEEMRATALVAAVHGFSMETARSSENALAIQYAQAYLEAIHG
jgi:hypothetical protein